MGNEPDRDPAWAQLEEFRRETAEAGLGWSAFLRRRLLLWALRWLIGFSGIFLVTHFYPGLAWLWWAGAGLALLSLCWLFAAQRLLARKFARAEAAGDELEAALHDLETAHPLDEERSG